MLQLAPPNLDSQIYLPRRFWFGREKGKLPPARGRMTFLPDKEALEHRKGCTRAVGEPFGLHLLGCPIGIFGGFSATSRRDCAAVQAFILREKLLAAPFEINSRRSAERALAGVLRDSALRAVGTSQRSEQATPTTVLHCRLIRTDRISPGHFRKRPLAGACRGELRGR